MSNNMWLSQVPQQQQQNSAAYQDLKYGQHSLGLAQQMAFWQPPPQQQQSTQHNLQQPKTAGMMEEEEEESDNGVNAGGIVTKKTKKGGAPKGVKPPQLRKWDHHLALYRQAHPKMSLKEAMMKASVTYRRMGGKKKTK